MSRLYDAIKQAEEKANIRGAQGLREGVVPPEQPAEVKRPPQLVPRRKRSAPSGSSTLFQSNPDENVKLWMQNCFPDSSLSREDAIREWLARPPGLRGRTFADRDPGSEQPDDSEMPTPAPQEATNGPQPNTIGGNVRPRSEWNPQVIHGGKEGSPSDHSRKLPKFLIKPVIYSALALVVVELLWGIPANRFFSHAAPSVTATQSQAAAPEAAPSMPASHGQSGIDTRSNISAQPSRIESLSLGCEETLPCIEIGTQGREVVPTLSTLTDPDRLVIDFRDVVNSSGIRNITVGRGAVKAVRIGLNAEAQTPSARVVIDLTTKCDYELQTLTDKFVLKLNPKAIPSQPE